MLKYPDKGNLREEEFILAPRSRVQSRAREDTATRT